jgi:hypothetical protein
MHVGSNPARPANHEESWGEGTDSVEGVLVFGYQGTVGTDIATHDSLFKF